MTLNYNHWHDTKVKDEHLHAAEDLQGTEMSNYLLLGYVVTVQLLFTTN